MPSLYPYMWKIIFSLLLSFPTSYLVESGFSAANNIVTKHRNCLKIAERGDLRLFLNENRPRHPTISCSEASSRISLSKRRELKTFPLKPAVISKLTSAGFSHVGDFSSIKPADLSSEGNITFAEAVDVLETMFEDVNAPDRKLVAPVLKSAFDLLQEEVDQAPIVTLCESFDDMLGGGVPLCKITEICGVPGAGKTQMCMQLAVDAHIPESHGGLGGEAVYIDTEGSFVIERMVEIAEAVVQHCQFIAEQEGLVSTNCMTVDAILAGTHYYRCQDHVELIATVNLLSKFLKQHEKVRLVIVDSIACPFRNHFDDMSVRTRLLAILAQSLIKIASQFKVAIVLTNQMTTKITAGAGSSHLIPALGESWSHVSTVRVVLSWEDRKRQAWLLKSPNKPESSCAFEITKDGIRDVLQDNLSSHSSSSSNSHAAAAVTSCHVSVTTKTDTVGFCLPLKKQRIT